MACDLGVLVEDAYIRLVGLQHGSVPSAGATQWLPILVGDRRAREILMLCKEIPARKAEEWGLVNRVVQPSELDATVDGLVAELADRLPLITRYAKQQLDFWRDLAWHGTIRHAHDWLALSMLSEDAAAGVQGFLDRKEKNR
jgi:enoyl-CoA hydratase/carnithine racemase